MLCVIIHRVCDFSQGVWWYAQFVESDHDKNLILKKFLKRNYSWFSLLSWRSQFLCPVLFLH